MRAPLTVLAVRRRAVVRSVVLAMLVVGLAVVAAAPAIASGPTALGVSGWQVYATSNIYSNPDSLQVHGDPGEYAAAPAIPAQNDAGWADCGSSSPQRSSPYASTLPLCPDSTIIGMAVGSILPGCWSGLNFTYFQALVSIPAGTNVSQFSVNMHGADDGARISLVNSQYPNGVTPSAGYIYQGTPQSTGDLSSYVVAGEVNRVVITQVDDCAVGNNLNSAQVFLNGVVVPPAPTDTTAPADSPAVSPAANAAGWNNGDVSVNWNWTDAGSGIDSSNCVQSSTSTGEGAITLSSTCADVAGNSASDSVTVKVDKTAPAASPVVTPAPNAAGWNNGDVTVAWNWTDAGSGIDPSNCVQSSASTGEGAVTLTSTCSDLAGNSASDSMTVNVDKTAPADSPVVTPAANAAGWNNGDATVAWNWTDAGSGIDTANCVQSSASTGEGVLTLTSTCADLAGNTATDSVQVKVDETAPTLAPSVSPNPLGLGDSATVSANASDSGSGIASTHCGPASTSSLGTFTVTCTATDKAGNTASATATYEVSGRATKQEILAQMQSALSSASRHDGDGLREAVAAVRDSLSPRLWADDNHPSSKRVFEDEQHAVDQLSELLHDRRSAIPAATVQGWINGLVAEDQALATVAIADATAAGGDARTLAQAAKELAMGNAEAARGRANAAIEHYGNAWQQTQKTGRGGDGHDGSVGHDR